MREEHMAVVIEAAHVDDLQAILALLQKSGLPQDGLSDHVTTTLVAREDHAIVGSAALELYGTVALLRSVAVADQLRGRGLGQQLTKEALKLAEQHGVTLVYLLTETASGFFPRFGFRSIPRSEVAPAIHASTEWTTACPDTAQAMVADLHAMKSERTAEESDTGYWAKLDQIAAEIGKYLPEKVDAVEIVRDVRRDLGQSR